VNRARRWEVAVAGIGLIALLLWEWSGLDLALTRAYGSPSGFVWRDAWLTRTLLHDGGRALAWAVMVLWLLTLGLDRGIDRMRRLRWIGVSLLCLLLSIRPCRSGLWLLRDLLRAPRTPSARRALVARCGVRGRGAVRLGAIGAWCPLREPHVVDGVVVLGGVRERGAAATAPEEGRNQSRELSVTHSRHKASAWAAHDRVPGCAAACSPATW
jgi:hypothetical protein